MSHLIISAVAFWPSLAAITLSTQIVNFARNFLTRDFSVNFKQYEGSQMSCKNIYLQTQY